MQPGEKKRQPYQMSRRAFLCGLSTTITGVFLAACGPPRSTNRAEIAFGPQATPQIILPSPMPPAVVATVLPEPGGLPLEEFLTLSAALTGVANLSPLLGAVYLQSLQRTPDFNGTIADLYQRAGFSPERLPTLAALQANGFFAEEATRNLLSQITKLWYTGIYTNEEGEEVVATFVDALALQTLRFTKPMTICGYPGFWSEAWEQVLD